MEEDKTSKQEKNAARKERHALRQARQSQYVRELMDDLEGRPEEVIGGLSLISVILFLLHLVSDWRLIMINTGERNFWS